MRSVQCVWRFDELEGGGRVKYTKMLGAVGEGKFGMAKEAADKKGARRMSEGVGAGGRRIEWG